MMGQGISIGDATGVNINGIRCGVVSDLAVALAKAGSNGIRRASADDSFTGEEIAIAHKAAHLLVRMREKGYSQKDCRKAFMQKIVDEAQRSRKADAVRQVAVNHPEEGSTPSPGAKHSEQLEINAISEGQERQPRR